MVPGLIVLTSGHPTVQWLRNHGAVPARLGMTDLEARKLLLHLQEERVWVYQGNGLV